MAGYKERATWALLTCGEHSQTTAGARNRCTLLHMTNRVPLGWKKGHGLLQAGNVTDVTGSQGPFRDFDRWMVDPSCRTSAHANAPTHTHTHTHT